MLQLPFLSTLRMQLILSAILLLSRDTQGNSKLSSLLLWFVFVSGAEEWKLVRTLTTELHAQLQGFSFESQEQ